jgi:hypothetical protein
VSIRAIRGLIDNGIGGIIKKRRCSFYCFEI